MQIVTDGMGRNTEDLSSVRRTTLRLLHGFAICTLALACTPRGTGVVYPAAKDVGAPIPVIVATSRAAAPAPEHFSGQRSAALAFARFAVSIPPDRTPGTVRFPTATAPDPQRDFLTVTADRLAGRDGFIRAVNSELSALKKTTATVFVHGYNTNFVEGLYRQAQLHADYADPGLSVNYSWPSAAATRFYVYDIESAIFARTGFEATINALTRSRVTGMTLVSHSMGGQVLMETLHQMALRGDRSAFRKIKDVVLLSPDVNVELFNAQMQQISPIDFPIYIVVSGRDEALQISSRLRGGQARLGALRENVWETSGYNVKVIDLTEVKGGDQLRHFSAGSSPSVVALVRGLNQTGVAVLNDSDGNSGFFSDSMDVIEQGADLVLRPRGGI